MNEDRDTRDRDDGSTPEGTTEGGLPVVWDVWARAAEQALRDMDRAQRHAVAPEKGTARNGIP
jgi:hypothetical protein